MPRGYKTEGAGPNPSGLCKCGCGGRTALAKSSDHRTGDVRGTPRAYILRHQRRTNDYFYDPNPSGLCLCGCGQPTTVRGLSHGKYVQGHVRRLSAIEYVEQDCGYDTPCWVWQRSLNQIGYGVGSLLGRSKRTAAHRQYYEAYVGPVPKGLELDHLCGIRACVNPEHLEPVTHTENVRRGRQTKLTLVKAQEIRAQKAAGVSTADLAVEYGVTKQCICMVVLGQTWK